MMHHESNSARKGASNSHSVPVEDTFHAPSFTTRQPTATVDTMMHQIGYDSLVHLPVLPTQGAVLSPRDESGSTPMCPTTNFMIQPCEVRGGPASSLHLNNLVGSADGAWTGTYPTLLPAHNLPPIQQGLPPLSLLDQLVLRQSQMNPHWLHMNHGAYATTRQDIFPTAFATMDGSNHFGGVQYSSSNMRDRSTTFGLPENTVQTTMYRYLPSAARGESTTRMMSHQPSTSVNAAARMEATDNTSVLDSSLTLRLLPTTISHATDDAVLSEHQVYLRKQIEYCQASEQDVLTPKRGRNKAIVLGQVGIRCRHCAHVPLPFRQSGSTYYPASMKGLYQAAQNMLSTHLQCGKCASTPDSVKNHFKYLLELPSKTSRGSMAGRAYWAKCATELGLVDTEDGIFVLQELPPQARFLHG